MAGIVVVPVAAAGVPYRHGLVPIERERGGREREKRQ